MRCGHHLGSDGPLLPSKCMKKLSQNNCNHVLKSWHMLLKTSYLHCLTETLEWSIVFWLVNHSNCLNGQWLVSQSLILSPNHKVSFHGLPVSWSAVTSFACWQFPRWYIHKYLAEEKLWDAIHHSDFDRVPARKRAREIDENKFRKVRWQRQPWGYENRMMRVWSNTTSTCLSQDKFKLWQ